MWYNGPTEQGNMTKPHCLLISDEEIIGFSSLDGAINYARMRYGILGFVFQSADKWQTLLISEVNPKKQQVKIEIL